MKMAILCLRFCRLQKLQCSEKGPASCILSSAVLCLCLGTVVEQRHIRPVHHVRASKPNDLSHSVVWAVCSQLRLNEATLDTGSALRTDRKAPVFHHYAVDVQYCIFNERPRNEPTDRPTSHRHNSIAKMSASEKNPQWTSKKRRETKTKKTNKKKQNCLLKCSLN